MRTIHLRLVPSDSFPGLYRTAWEFTDVSVPDVLDKGVHPWTGNPLFDMVQVFEERLNREDAKPIDLGVHGMTGPVHLSSHVSPSTRNTAFERALDQLAHECWFIHDGTTYPVLLHLAKASLQERWSNHIALSLAEKLHGDFPGLRRFLKAKDRSVKLSGYGDLSSYDWGEHLSVDDFASHERVLLEFVLRPVNFRRSTALGLVTDRLGRLCMRDQMEAFRLTQRVGPNHLACPTWHGHRRDDHWFLAPSINNSSDLQTSARDFARRWARGTGNLCFRTTTADIEALVEGEEASLHFPGLRYGGEDITGQAQANLPSQRVRVYSLGGYPTAKCTGDTLKTILREYEAPMSGTKEALVTRVASVAAEQYTKQKEELDRFFHRNRLLRVASMESGTTILRALPEGGTLAHLVTHLYVMRHLRENVVVDPGYENPAASPKDTARALMAGHVKLTGGFVEAV